MYKSESVKLKELINKYYVFIPIFKKNKVICDFRTLCMIQSSCRNTNSLFCHLESIKNGKRIDELDKKDRILIKYFYLLNRMSNNISSKKDKITVSEIASFNYKLKTYFSKYKIKNPFLNQIVQDLRFYVTPNSSISYKKKIRETLLNLIDIRESLVEDIDYNELVGRTMVNELRSLFLFTHIINTSGIRIEYLTHLLANKKHNSPTLFKFNIC